MKIIYEEKNVFLLGAILTGTFMLFMFFFRYTHIAKKKKQTLTLTVNLLYSVISLEKKC